MAVPSKKLFLLDAFALIYRSHFAFSKNPRINSKGLNTGAILGFTNTLLDIIHKEKPTHIGVAFDSKEPTFRHIEYVEYKAQRQKQPEDITLALPYIFQICEAFQIPMLALSGYEADDIVGTIAKKAAKSDFEVFMMSSDKDYAQLVEEHIFLYKPAFLGNAVDILGVKEVLEKWKIKRVDQVIDFLGLQGDAVDNIPGIPGIGEKTAISLLEKFDSMENLIANADQLSGKQRDNVKNFAQQGLLSKRLATIEINVPIDFEEEVLAYKGFDEQKLRNLFEELEFRTLKKRVFGDDPTSSNAEKNVKKTTKTNLLATPQTDIFGNSGENQQTAIPQSSPSPSKKTIQNIIYDYHLVDNQELRTKLIEQLNLQNEFCFDTETTSADPYHAELVGISFCFRKSEAYYVPIPAEKTEALKIVQEFKQVLENQAIGKIGQNLKYDIMVLQSYEIKVKGKFFDTMLAHYLLEPDQRHNMDSLSENYLNYSPISIEELIGKKGKNQLNMRQIAVAEVAKYACEDADVTWQLKEVFEAKIKETKIEKLFEDVEIPLLEVLAQIERNGVKIDEPALKIFSKELETDLGVIEQEIYLLAGQMFNISSPKQMGEILFEKLKIGDKTDKKLKKTKTGQYATGEEVLADLEEEHEIVRKILEFRELQKLKSTYVDSFPELVSPKDGLIHTSYNQAVAATGRLSSTNPNLQNIPIKTAKGKEIRKAFVPRNPDFILLSADYSQIELRIMAEFSEDESMLLAFKNGLDIHSITASKIYKVALEEVTPEMRRNAKTANFGIIYGISAHGFSQRLHIPRKESVKIIDSYFAEFPSVKGYMDKVINFAREHEYVETIMKRRRYLRDINSRNFSQRSFAERNAINAPIQGSAADLIKIAMVNIHKYLSAENLQSKMIMQVHDELVFDIYRPELEQLMPKIKELMTKALPLKVPLEVEAGVGENWLVAY